MDKKILVAGDVAIDHLYHPSKQQDQGQNWQLYPALQTTLLPGGAFILTEFVKAAVQAKGLKAETSGPIFPVDPYGTEARKIIQAKVLLNNYKEDKIDFIRVDKYYGYSAPTENTFVLPQTADIADPDLLLLDDAGNGFRDQEEAFPSCINNPKTLLVYKMSRPLAQGPLWEKVSSREGDWVLLLHAKDIRQCNNVHVSKALSWERTAMEMAYQLKRNAALADLHKAPYLVVLFGLDGALLVPRNADEPPMLIFDPKNLEGGFAASVKGLGLSTGSAFAASLCSSLLNNGLSGLVEGIKGGLSAMRNLLKNGFLLENKQVSYPLAKIFGGVQHQFSECNLKTVNDLNSADPQFWRIMDEKTRLSKPQVTVDIVKSESPAILKEIPVGVYGKMQTFDRSEIEQYNSIKNLILEYLDDPKTSRPLCIAVFGPPGSGKSFGIKQVLDSLGKGDSTMTFNISQYASYNDLIADFHKMRDEVLRAKIPVAFFDEFDSDKENKAMGWLKYFLCPMQDGEFKEGEAVHPIGKSIFVFAGGTRSSFEDFANNGIAELSKNKELTEEELKKDKALLTNQFRDAKGPDFVSRLRGFINILGPNPNAPEGCVDSTFMIRRAKILRVNFKSTEKTKQLFDSKDALQIDDSVLRAMLNIPVYKHGNRSMSAMLDMSRLAGKTKFDLSALPTPEQLDMHVDAKLFMWLTANERFYTLLPVEDRFELVKGCPMVWEQQLVEKIAIQMHEDYIHQRRAENQITSTTVPWADLPENKRNSNLDCAADLPVKLGKIDYGIRILKQNETVHTPDINDSKIELLAEHEHERWCRDQFHQGWKFGLVRNDEELIHNDLIPWKSLSEKVKNKDWQSIYSIPRILKKLGFCIYPIEAFETIDDWLIRKIAVAYHIDYCKKRTAEGQNTLINASMVPFENLTDELKQSNYDSARTIPRKLKLLGIELKKSISGTAPELLKFSDQEIELLSEWEHARWNWQKILQGWIYGPEKDIIKLVTPYLLPWKMIPDNIKEYDRENVRLIPEIIKEAGYEAVRKLKM